MFVDVSEKRFHLRKNIITNKLDIPSYLRERLLVRSDKKDSTWDVNVNIVYIVSYN